MPKRKRDDKGRFSKRARDIEGDVPIYLRMPKSLATDIRGLAARLNITLTDAFIMASERLVKATDLPLQKVEEKPLKFKF